MPTVGGRLVGRCPRCGAYGNSMALCAGCVSEMQKERDKDRFKFTPPPILPDLKLPKKIDPLDPFRR